MMKGSEQLRKYVPITYMYTNNYVQCSLPSSWLAPLLVFYICKVNGNGYYFRKDHSDKIVLKLCCFLSQRGLLKNKKIISEWVCSALSENGSPQKGKHLLHEDKILSFFSITLLKYFTFSVDPFQKGQESKQVAKKLSLLKKEYKNIVENLPSVPCPLERKNVC